MTDTEGKPLTKENTEPVSKEVETRPINDYLKPKDLEGLYNIPVEVTVVLGKAKMRVDQLLKMNRGAVIQLDNHIGDAVDIYANDERIGKGEVVVVDDRLGVAMTDLVADR